MGLISNRTRNLSGFEIDKEKWKKRIAYWKSYPDVWYYQMRGENAPYGTLVYNDFALRVMAHYRYVFVACTRGFTKTYTDLRQKFHKCVFFPGVVETIVGPTKEQAADVVKEALSALLKNYPVLANEFTVILDIKDTLVLLFRNGSILRTESTSNTARGGNDTDLGVEECTQKEFNHDLFNGAILPRLRLMRRVRGIIDDSAEYLQQTYMTSVRGKQNPAYKIFKSFLDMMSDENKRAYVIQASIDVPIMFGIIPKEEVELRRKNMPVATYREEYGAIWSGSSEGYILKDTTVEAARQIKLAEFEYNPTEMFEYLVSVDIARESGAECAYCAICVFRMSPITDKDNPGCGDKLWKDLIYIERLKDVTHRELAIRIKEVVKKYKAYEVCIDGNGLGVATRDELMCDLGDGNPPYAVINDKEGKLIGKTLPGAVAILYVLKSSTSEDKDSLTVPNAQAEFEQGNVRLLIDGREGLELYKKYHKIKDDIWDNEIAMPYAETYELTTEISNLVQKSEGSTFAERRVSNQIQRDIWSAVKYGLWRVKAHEETIRANENSPNEWEKEFKTKKSALKALTVKSLYSRSDSSGYTMNSLRPFGTRRMIF